MALITIRDQRGGTSPEISACVESCDGNIALLLLAPFEGLRDIWFSDEYCFCLSIRHANGAASAMHVIMKDYNENDYGACARLSFAPAEVLKALYV